MSEQKSVGEVAVERGKVTPEQMEEIEKGEFITVSEIANRLRYSYQWVLWMLQEGRIKGIKPLGGRWRVPRSEFERILKGGLPPMPREQAKPPVTEIEVKDKKIVDKVKEPPPKKEPPGPLFPFSLFNIGGKK